MPAKSTTARKNKERLRLDNARAENRDMLLFRRRSCRLRLRRRKSSMSLFSAEGGEAGHELRELLANARVHEVAVLVEDFARARHLQAPAEPGLRAERLEHGQPRRLR